MFEVGKKYKGESGRVYECVWANEHYAVLKADKNPPVAFYQIDRRDFTEYVEPKATTSELFVRLDTTSGEMWGSESYLKSNTYFENVGKIRITHTEGVGLSVEVL